MPPGQRFSAKLDMQMLNSPTDAGGACYFVLETFEFSQTKGDMRVPYVFLDALVTTKATSVYEPITTIDLFRKSAALSVFFSLFSQANRN